MNHEEIIIRNKTILERYRTLRAKKIRQYDAIDVINKELKKPLDYWTILHIITETNQDEKREEQTRSKTTNVSK